MSVAKLNQHQLEELRCLLVARQQELEAQLLITDSSTKPVTLDQQSVGRVSRIDAIQQQQMAIASQKQANQILKQVELSLSRIDSEDYGICLQCQETIAFARLQAQPFAGLCLGCQSASEGA
jgi:DnaK suppressor protein